MEGEQLDHGSAPGAGKEDVGQENVYGNGKEGISTAWRDGPAGGDSGTRAATIIWKKKLHGRPRTDELGTGR